MRNWRRPTPTTPACPPSHDAYGALAEEIDLRVRQQVEAGKDNPMMIATIVDDLTAEARRDLIREKFGQLEDARQWELLVEYFDDDVIRQALEDDRKLAVAKADPDAYAELLARQTRRSRELRLGKIMEGMRLIIHLYTREAITKPPHKLVKLNPARTLVLALIDTENMWWRVLDDTYDGGRFSGAQYVPGTHSRIFVGCPTSDKRLTSVVSHGTPVEYIREVGQVCTSGNFLQRQRGKDDYPELLVGRCRLNDVEMFHDPADETPTSDKPEAKPGKPKGKSGGKG